MVPIPFGTLAADAAGKSIETGLSPQTRRLFRRQQFRGLLKAKIDSSLKGNICVLSSE